MLEPFEMVLLDRMISQLKATKLMAIQHHGFWQERSHVINLIGFLDKVSGRMDMGKRVEVRHLDSQKAFDSVNYRFACRKLKAFMWIIR